MRPNPYITQALKYATFTLLGCGAIVAGAGLMRGTANVPLAGRLTVSQQQGVIPTMRFDEHRAIDGFSAPADTHAIFTVPLGIRIPRVTFFGGQDYDQKRYWGYCFSGNEAANKQRGLRGKGMYDGQFFYSLGERKAQSERPVPSDDDLPGILQATVEVPERAPASIAEILYGGQTCYVMSEVILPVGVDTDGDTLNSERERELQTDLNNPDSDGDGIPDGSEVFVTKTQPKERDSDRDGLGDRCEDANMNGKQEKTETNALNPDTDRDGLCDGNGSGSACPEPKQVTCFLNAAGDRECESRPSFPVSGEDMNQNCAVDQNETDPKNPSTFGVPDFEHKWRQMQSQLGNRQSDSAIGRDAPELFPIPVMPREL